MRAPRRPTARRPLLGLLLAVLLAGPLAVTTTPAQALPDERPSSWTIGFGSLGPVTTDMTVAQAIAVLHSKASSKPDTPYCGLFGLTGDLPTGLAGWAPKKGGRLALLSVGSLLGSSHQGLPKVVRTSKGIGLGSSLASIEAAYPRTLTTTTDHLNEVEVVRGPRGLGIAFEISGGEVVNIATGRIKTLVLPEYCG